MSSLIFVFKVSVLTALIVMALQIQWDGKTLERRGMDYLWTSEAGQSLVQAASGGAVLIRRKAEDMSQKAKELIEESKDSAPARAGR